MWLSWQQLIAEWRHRLLACQARLQREDADLCPTLRMQDRILRFLLRRYAEFANDQTPVAPLEPAAPPVHFTICSAYSATPFHSLLPPPIIAVASADHPPRRSRHLRPSLVDIHEQLTSSPVRPSWTIWLRRALRRRRSPG